MLVSKKIIKAVRPHLTGVRQGLERETLRVTPTGHLANTPHPSHLGSPLKHPNLTLDFAEAQLEFTTPPVKTLSAAQRSITNLQNWASRYLKPELLWPFSLPPILPAHQNIPLANFGTAAAAEKKMLYRVGLQQRYGGAMQTISGIHYNFSFGDTFWQALARERGSKKPVWQFKDEGYFAQMRNIIRYTPLVTYLFGASPFAHASYFVKTPKNLRHLEDGTYYGPYATSLRLSEFGYHNSQLGKIKISYNSLPRYLDGLAEAISTPSTLWSTLGAYKGRRQVQLNTNILQLENEFYTAVRPKQKTHEHQNGSVLCSLACAGVEYVELRSIDLDPFEPSGLGTIELAFLQTFMVWCTLAPSPEFGAGEQILWEQNQRLVALRGREPGLRLWVAGEKKLFTQWAAGLLQELRPVAEALDASYGTKRFSRSVNLQRNKIIDPHSTPSGQLLKELLATKQSYISFGVALAQANQAIRRASPLPKKLVQKLESVAKKSLADQAAAEAHDAWILSGYENLEQSTQVLIRAALKRNIAVEVIDAATNVVRLVKGARKEIVKQGTITRRDTYLAYELLKNKQLTKLFLSRAGIRAPAGELFTTREDALHYYHDAPNRNKPLVIKPVDTNYGTGVSVVGPKQKEAYQRAVAQAFRHSQTIIVEEFVPGKEFRFLVINNAVVGVLNREPANVVGDGAHTIAALVSLKNQNPKNYKRGLYVIRLGTIEKSILAAQKLTPAIVLPKNKKIYLRHNSNISSGGDPVDVTDQMPSAYKKIALEAARALGARIVGVDMIIKSLREPPRAGNHAIIEANWNPALFMHSYPFSGQARDVGGAVLDFLGF